MFISDPVIASKSSKYHEEVLSRTPMKGQWSFLFSRTSPIQTNSFSVFENCPKVSNSTGNFHNRSGKSHFF